MISVIVPVYNVEKYLNACLDSIVNQTYRDIEILCIDDCTPDNSIEIVEQYILIDSRVRLIQHDENRGLGGARNTGIREANGEYITFVDSDDTLKPDMLEKFIKAITEHDVDAVVSGVDQSFENDYFVPHSTFHYIDKMTSGICNVSDHKERLTNMWPSAWNKMYKTSIIREFGCKYPEKLLYEDHFFFYNYFAHIRAFYYIDEPLYIYRLSRPGSITSSRNGREKEVYKVLADLEPVFETHFDKNLYRREYAKICFRLIWERQFIFRNNMDAWREFVEDANHWLMERFDNNFLKASVDTFISEADMFYQYIFEKDYKRMISVIVPVYNVEKYLDECLESIVNQTYKNIEILCIDDCTLDNSVNIIKKYMRKDSRVRLINHYENRGLGGARNTGIREAKGEYITFVDSDDLLKPDILEKYMKAMTSYKVDAVICGVEQSFGNDYFAPHTSFHYLEKLSSRVFYIPNNKERLTDMWPSAWNKMYKTSLIREFECKYPEKLLYEDHFFFYNYFAHVNAFYYIDEPLYIYRLSRPGSITSTRSGREKEVYKVLSDLEPVFQKYFDKDQYRKAYAKICFRLIWERQFIFRSNVSEWRSFVEEAERWLLERFDIAMLKSSVDTFIPRTDEFCQYLFETGLIKIKVRMKVALKTTRFGSLLRKIYHRIKKN